MDAYAEGTTTNTSDAPLVLGDVKWGDGVLNTHNQIEQFLEEVGKKHADVRRGW